jgi:predicted nucleotidyltransferase
MDQLNYDRERLEALCRNYHVKRLAVFGSVLSGEDTPASDLDLLVEFSPESPIGLFGLMRLQRELGNLFGKNVDLNTAGFLNRSFRDDVVQHAKAIYAR